MYYRWLRSVGTVLFAVLIGAMACSTRGAPTPLPGCDGAPRPVVFAHGMMGGGDNFANTMMRFASNGYCREYLRAFDWNTLSFDLESHAEALADYIDGVLDETGADQVDLVGHSMGGRLSQAYLAEEKRSAKVAHYVHAASFCDLEFPDSVPLLVLSSDEDTVVGPCAIAGADNQDVHGADHLQMVTLPDAFLAMYRFFNDGQPPATTDIIPEETVALSGKVLTFGTNLPVAEAVVEVYSLDGATGERLDKTPVVRLTVGEDASWGPFSADPSTYYEFLVSGGGERPFHYYRQPFARSDPTVYLRIMPESDFLLNRMLGEIRYDDRSSIVVLFSADQALYYGRDSATLDGIDLVTPEMAPPPPDPASTIAIFILDADGNGRTDGGPVPGPLAQTPFLQQYDAFVDAGVHRTVTLTVNGATLHVPALKADSEGVVIVVFEQAGS